MLGWNPRPQEEPASKPAVASPVPRAVRLRIRTEPEKVRDAVDLLDRFERAHVYGTNRPTPEEASVAWQVLEQICLPVAGFLRACIALEKAWPLRRRGEDATKWLFALLDHISENVETIVAGIWVGAELEAWRAVEDLMHRQVQHTLRGSNPVVVYLNGPEVRREVHIRDSVCSKEHPQGRVIICRVYEHGRNGRLEIVDGGGGRLARETVLRSRWTICEGWVAIGGLTGRPGQPAGKGGGQQLESTPSAKPKP
jgi:hypothetical protein